LGVATDRDSGGVAGMLRPVDKLKEAFSALRDALSTRPESRISFELAPGEHPAEVLKWIMEANSSGRPRYIVGPPVDDRPDEKIRYVQARLHLADSVLCE